MTDVVLDLTAPAETAGGPSPRRSPSHAAVGLASLSASAGLIHVALTPSHMGEWALEGAGFALAASVQLGAAVALLRRRALAALQLTIVANLALIAAWIVSRTSGFPFGPHAGHAEKLSVIDVVAVALEASLVIGAFAAIVRPHVRVTSAPVKAVVPLLAVLAASLAILSPSARNHADDAHGDHDTHDAADEGVFAGGDDRGFSLLHNGHHAEMVTYDLDPRSKQVLDSQLAITRKVATQYATVAAAEAAGYRRAGPYIPGLGAHWVRLDQSGLNFDGDMQEDDLLHPASLQFDGVERTSKLAGFMYVSASVTEPDGFIGRNDVWHYHSSLCVKYVDGHLEFPFGADHEASSDQCASVGGMIWPQTVWMLHVWSVPGYSNPFGVFGEHSPKLDCSDGSYYVLPAKDWATHLTNVCKADAD